MDEPGLERAGHKNGAMSMACVNANSTVRSFILFHTFFDDLHQLPGAR